MDTGDFVIVVNAEKLAVSTKKGHDKIYYRHSGYPGGIRSDRLEQLLVDDPERVIKLAVRRMLPKNRLGRQQIKKLRVYAGPNHDHGAQQPKERKLSARAYALPN
jgi:large subunit ribosomal protein L13